MCSTTVPKGTPYKPAQHMLHHWHVEIWEQDHLLAVWGFDAIMSNKHLKFLLPIGPIPSLDQLKTIFANWEAQLHCFEEMVCEVSLFRLHLNFGFEFPD